MSAYLQRGACELVGVRSGDAGVNADGVWGGGGSCGVRDSQAAGQARLSAVRPSPVSTSQTAESQNPADPSL